VGWDLSGQSQKAFCAMRTGALAGQRLRSNRFTALIAL
jgi:hypothetical protein